MMVDIINYNTPDDLIQEMSRVPHDICTIGGELAEVTETAARTKAERDRVHARLSLEMSVVIQEKGDKPAEWKVKNMVASHPEYTEIISKLISAEARRDSLRCEMEALKAKKDMLQSITGIMRSEMSTIGR